jgi:hypothetical protein
VTTFDSSAPSLLRSSPLSVAPRAGCLFAANRKNSYGSSSIEAFDWHSRSNLRAATEFAAERGTPINCAISINWTLFSGFGVPDDLRLARAQERLRNLRQLGDVGGDAPGLVAGEEVRHPATLSGPARAIACTRRKKC